MTKLTGKTWESLTITEKENMFMNCKYSIPGEVIYGEMVIKDNAIFYNPTK